MTVTTPRTGPCEGLPYPAPGPADVTLTLAISAAQSACLDAIGGRWAWPPAHVAEWLLTEELHCRFMDDQEQHAGEVAL